MATYYVTTSGDNANAGTSEGAAWADLGYAVTQATSDGDIIYIKTGTYTLTTSTPGASGPIVCGTNTLTIESYNSAIGDKSGVVTISAGTETSITVIKLGGNFAKPQNIYGLNLDCVSSTNNGFANAGSAHGVATKCRVINGNLAFSTRSVKCIAESCTVGFSSGNSSLINLCFAKNCGTGFGVGQNSTSSYCISSSCTTGFQVSFYSTCLGCISYNASTGFYIPSNTATVLFVGCIASSCTTGWNYASSHNFQECASYANTDDFSGIPFNNIDFISLSENPFEDVSNDNFTITSTELLNASKTLKSTDFFVHRLYSQQTIGGSTLHPLYATGRK
jgi:hypothetical protein